MNKFSDFGIKSTQLVGEKLKMEQIINKKIIVTDYKLEKSKYPKGDNDKCLYLQILHEGSKNVVFTSSNVLIDIISQIDRDLFPFEATIVRIGKHYEFV